MTITHHPSETVLADFASSVLDEAAALVVAAHVAQCPECQKAVRQFEAIGGALLEDEDVSEEMSVTADGLLDRAGPDGDASPMTDTAHASAVPDADEVQSAPPVDRLINLYEGGKWRWLGPGVHWRSISVPSDEGIRVFMLKARSGTSLPHHRHSGIEWTTVLEGAFEHAQGRFGPGDFDEADSSVEHEPVVAKGADCICLVAMNGRLELQGVIGRMLQPFVRL